MNNNITLNLNIASYYLNHLASPDISTWHTGGGPITQTTKNLGLHNDNKRDVERTRKMAN